MKDSTDRFRDMHTDPPSCARSWIASLAPCPTGFVAVCWSEKVLDSGESIAVIRLATVIAWALVEFEARDIRTGQYRIGQQLVGVWSGDPTDVTHSLEDWIPARLYPEAEGVLCYERVEVAAQRLPEYQKEANERLRTLEDWRAKQAQQKQKATAAERMTEVR